MIWKATLIESRIRTLYSRRVLTKTTHTRASQNKKKVLVLILRKLFRLKETLLIIALKRRNEGGDTWGFWGSIRGSLRGSFKGRFERSIKTLNSTYKNENGEDSYVRTKWSFSVKTIFVPKLKKRRKKTQDTMYSAMSSIPSGGPPGGAHTQELWYSLRGIDARLESVLSTDKCLCDARCARFSTPNFVVFVLVFWTEKFFVRG